MEISLTPRQKQLLDIIYNYLKDTGYPPTFEEMRLKLNVSSNQSVIDLLQKLEKKGLIKRSEAAARGLALLPLGSKLLNKPPLVPHLGTSAAGLPINVEEISGNWQPFSADLSKLEDEVFLLKISGDSMINAGINDGSTVLVQNAKEFFSKEIVLANVSGEYTVKRFISEDKPPYLYLKPENPKYNIIYFTDEVTLKGKVIAVLTQGQWKLLNENANN